MLNHCSCIAIVSSQSEVNKAIGLLSDIDIDCSCLSVVSKNSKSDDIDIDALLKQSRVPEGSRYCYRCVIETGLILIIVQGDNQRVEAASEQLEKINDVDISIHLDIPFKEK